MTYDRDALMRWNLAVARARNAYYDEQRFPILRSHDPRHGTVPGYNAHNVAGEQACDRCLRAWRKYQRDWARRNRRNSPPNPATITRASGPDGRTVVDGIKHGISGYTYHRCRCPICTEANTNHSRERRQGERGAA